MADAGGSFFDIAGPDELPKFATRLGPLVAYSWITDGHDLSDPGTGRTIDDLWIWHWCAPHGFWRPTGVRAHTLISVEPLHVEASAYWPDCCGLHGFIRGGIWTDA